MGTYESKRIGVINQGGGKELEKIQLLLSFKSFDLSKAELLQKERGFSTSLSEPSDQARLHRNDSIKRTQAEMCYCVVLKHLLIWKKETQLPRCPIHLFKQRSLYGNYII